jgi:hypothetical protein
MKKSEQFRQHAQECRALARTAKDETERNQLLKMAESWDSLAHERTGSKRAAGNGS